MADNRYSVDYARLGTSKCKKCKQGIAKKEPRIAKLVTNPFSEDGGDMKQYHHVKCMFEALLRARPTTKKIDDPEDLEGFDVMEEEDKKTIKELIADLALKTKNKVATPSKKKTVQATLSASGHVVSPSKKVPTPSASNSDLPSTSTSTSVSSATTDISHSDNSFREFRKLCARIADQSAYLAKTREVETFIKKGSSGDGFQGDTYLLLKLLLPGVVKRVYNINSKQLVKVFSQIFGANLEEMVTDLDQGDVAETVQKFFSESAVFPPAKKSTLSIHEVDDFLEGMAALTKETDQQRHLTGIAKRCTANDLKMVVRLIKHDLRINSGAKHILEALDPNAYEAFQASRNLRDVVDRVNKNKEAADGRPGMSKKLSVRATLMTPVLPMLAEACKSVDMAMRKCPNGMFAEIKYDGERVQIHKQGDTFQYFSRSLKPVLPHKVVHIKDYLPKACPHGNSIILDSEILMVDKTGKILPFGTLGIHKKNAFSDANVCLFIFDCLHFNGENLMDRPMKERRKILEQNLTPVKNRIMLSESKDISVASDLSSLIMSVIREGLEGLVLKDKMSVYEPGKRHWLKVKKDYLAEGAMADTADLIVLGAYYGTGSKGGIMSTFLMGVHDPATDRFLTVTKCTGLDDQTLNQLNRDLAVDKISKDSAKVPSWLHVSRGLVPDFVVKDPKKAPVWEIMGAEFTQSDNHTAGGISIRFPRVSRFRDDKDWKTANNLERLKALSKKSKETSDIPDLISKKTASPAKISAQMHKRSKPASDVEEDEDYEGDTDEEVDEERKPSPAKKMKIDNGDGTSSAKGKPACKYGAQCYQTNPRHKTKYSHPAGSNGSPSKTVSPSKTQAASPSKPASIAPTSTVKPSMHSPAKGLANIFSGLSVYLPKTIADYYKLKRYVVAYDGDVLTDFNKANATHFVVDVNAEEKEATPPGKIGVTPAWIWECVKQKRILPASKFAPK
ncbi:DNA ligase 3-like [Acanthaster planci]|uniref:DNA ligase n=1 Tax=Acanthaster planci TaxID=133434 RepID=A0A8B7XZS1_ACAPL|nr:DNA ligase 3-like [Acanthaster planci]XP_022085531.1 DNA ligase 3-like [Acanthaster planci]XP_022085532.1 DNA ligase 3-like [Acanthaster planci]XP_022085533.1 DNA ligase 3-like [Acanthaster planci]XP_022085534.1 DNA ligase 3-like [Acanthaster planci]XP_022085535.1 DNA ligase 3-like [Acanthaster planci]XP_022085536.1 DNA ligase 3-like [Acanthaster planci]